MSQTATTASDRPFGFGRGLGDSVSLMLGYFPIAVSFGLLAVGQGLSPWQALLVSAVVYAGASQFTLVSLVAAGASPLSVIGAVAAMNLRHLFYGPVLLAQLSRHGRRLPRPLLAFGLTDEVFALASASITPRHGETWLFGVQMGAYGAWLAGTVTGAVAARIAGSGWPQGQAALAFVLPALFLALLLPLLRRNALAPLMVAAGAAVVLSRFIPGHAALLAAMIVGAALAAVLPAGEEAA
ncbi:putative AzlC-like protein [Magnetospirillum gryphiswaldense MSR-1 v2]|uniref:AzlC-like protein n=1 Tax=Magnetospirillum gryphiswaldense (strain DSM 6361 / JCM 21280 / NBRC 15271 / MSR-1) TaxID=431944 RepID=V6EWW7_MAGGM|nr:AzlC family ABC transporter permease [Magnetospirillum gryphiswaldense]CDK97597.1 putative AzlC-like protein [Magnetospirillum gryphiswaldense MSR-1 v2]